MPKNSGILDYIQVYHSIYKYIQVYTVIYDSCDRWKEGELKKTIEMLSRPEFDSKELDPDLHKRMQQAVQDGSINCFNLQEGPTDGDQDLDLWTRELEDVVREIMEDPVFKGNQNFSFELDVDAAGQRLFGGEANAGVAFQI